VKEVLRKRRDDKIKQQQNNVGDYDHLKRWHAEFINLNKSNELNIGTHGMFIFNFFCFMIVLKI
jgi:hypothetical protein